MLFRGEDRYISSVFCVALTLFMLASARSALAEDANGYVNHSLGEFFPEMHHEMTIERQRSGNSCGTIAGNIVFTAKSVRVLVFDDRDRNGPISVQARTERDSRIITVYHQDCGLQIQVYRSGTGGSDDSSLVPFDGSGIPGDEARQVGETKSIVDVAAFFPQSKGVCGGALFSFADDSAGLRLLTAGSVHAKTDFSDSRSSPGKRLSVSQNDCVDELDFNLLRRDETGWTIDDKVR